MRRLSLFLALVIGGCGWMTPPCAKLAKPVCDVGSEGDACAFVMNLDRNDEHAQAICKQITPAATALAQDPKSAEALAEWKTARVSLAALGLVTDVTRSRIDEKLKRANGIGGRLVDQAEKNSALGESQTAEGAERAFDAVNK
jgi:hypothetical protein